MRLSRAQIEQLLGFLLDGVTPLPEQHLEQVLREWLGASSRFAAFATANRDKIRKKLRTATEAEGRGDVLAELETAARLLGDRRFELAFEGYGSGRRGPDFTVTFRVAHRFNLEVTRPRERAAEQASFAIGNALLAKLRQFPVDSPNALFVATGLAASADEIAGAVRGLKLRADRGEEDPFVARGLSASEFQTLYRRLGALMVADAGGRGVHAWVNLEARRPLPAGAVPACASALEGWSAPQPA